MIDFVDNDDDDDDDDVGGACCVVVSETIPASAAELEAAIQHTPTIVHNLFNDTISDVVPYSML